MPNYQNPVTLGVVILRILQRYSAEESWVDNVLRQRGSLSEGFSSEGFSTVQHSVGAWVFGREMGVRGA
uniref:Uncharacterized protein n=1 Tax=Cucumis melo TaxID=3656 RepID=A0A9I9DQM4_CUCME